jgi:ribose 5-phosphate isomerase A
MNAVDLDPLKRIAAEKALDYVVDGMVVGIGTGSTADHFIRGLAQRRMNVVCVPTSLRSEKLAKQLGLRVESLVSHPSLDLDVDGADEIDPSFNLIKGGGGAHTSEKRVAEKSKLFVVIADYTKLVPKLGKFPVAIEFMESKKEGVEEALKALGGVPVLRRGFVTDRNNLIFDVRFNIQNPKNLEEEINAVSGVVENGIFACRRADVVIVGEGDEAHIVQKKDGSRHFK